MSLALAHLPALSIARQGLARTRRLAAHAAARIGRRLLASSRRRAEQRLRAAAGELPRGLPRLGTPWPTA